MVRFMHNICRTGSWVGAQTASSLMNQPRGQEALEQ